MIRRLTYGVLLALGLAVPSTAQWVRDVVRSELLTGWRTERGTHMTALRIELDPGWKTYWRAPGDAGIPPRFDWAGSTNIASVALHWPVPKIFYQNGIRSIGYEGAVTIPVEIRPIRTGELIVLDGTVEIGVCQDICIPVTLAVSADLSPTGRGSRSDLIESALEDRPMTAAEAGVGSVVCRLEPISDGMRLSVSMELPQIAPNEAAVVEFADPTVWVSEAAATRNGGTLSLESELVPAHAGPFALSRQDLRFTVLTDGRAVDIRGCSSE